MNLLGAVGVLESQEGLKLPVSYGESPLLQQLSRISRRVETASLRTRPGGCRGRLESQEGLKRTTVLGPLPVLYVSVLESQEGLKHASSALARRGG